MPGGLLNIVAFGDKNIILNGNPTKTFFKSTYVKYTNFGLQKFRIDFNGQTKLNNDSTSKFRFNIPHYGDLLMDTYLAIYMPNIWSSVYRYSTDAPNNNQFFPYHFKWIKNLGTQLIKKITFYIGGHVIQEFTGQYLLNLIYFSFLNF